MFSECEALEHIDIPNSVEIIGNYAFSKCINLKEIIIPDNVREIGEYAFNKCVNLKKIIISDNVRKIGNHAFYFCDAVEFVSRPNTGIEIGSLAFTFIDTLADRRISGNRLELRFPGHASEPENVPVTSKNGDNDYVADRRKERDKILEQINKLQKEKEQLRGLLAFFRRRQIDEQIRILKQKL